MIELLFEAIADADAKDALPPVRASSKNIKTALGLAGTSDDPAATKWIRAP